MTFYNVISGLLFLGAFRQLLVAIDLASLSQGLMASALAILVFNDAVYTSHVVEGEGIVAYKLNLMLVDLANFLLLALAMATINPSNNVFGVGATRVNGFLGDSGFWILLALYWVGVMVWTWLSGLYRQRHSRLLLSASAAIPVLFMLTALVGKWGSGPVFTTTELLSVIYILTYIALLRPRLLARQRGLTSA
jgi:hypothetical protein